MSIGVGGSDPVSENKDLKLFGGAAHRLLGTDWIDKTRAAYCLDVREISKALLSLDLAKEASVFAFALLSWLDSLYSSSMHRYHQGRKPPRSLLLVTTSLSNVHIVSDPTGLLPR